MTGREVTLMHTQLLQLSLIPEESQVFWQNYDTEVGVEHAYDEYWFGSVNKKTVRNLLVSLKKRFAQFPHCLYPLKKWSDISFQERNLVCHWHLQLSDPCIVNLLPITLLIDFFFLLRPFIEIVSFSGLDKLVPRGGLAAHKLSLPAS